MLADMHTHLQIGKHKVKISRSMDAMMPAFTRHFENKIAMYGPIVCVNLLEQAGEPDGERLLSEAFQSHVVG
jgi:hypothetical protein